jgi:aryl-alcohol dehydrogenase-like predicted oxidoreductase
MTKPKRIPKRRYRGDIDLSILGFGGMVLVGMERGAAGRVISEAVDQGVNYFDVAPFYGDGQAEQTMGAALVPYRNRVFLACKTLERSAKAARTELEASLRHLRTDHFDLYQFHAVTEQEEVEEIFAPGGALEAFLKARNEGKIRYMGFSAHSVEAAMSMLGRFQFDSLLFPVNYVLYAQGNFGPQVITRAKERSVSILAIKSMAHGPWRRGEKRKYPNCWYRPIEEKALARQALRFTLSEGATAAVPPGDERLFRMALELASDLPPLGMDERKELLDSTRGLRPLMCA